MTRLAAVCSIIEPAEVIADVGCDHGKVAGYCLEKGLAKRVIASDISESCLEKARLGLFGYKNVEFHCCNGIAYYCDEAIIAGMGGMLISDIIAAAEHRPKRLVLCPHRDDAQVRRTLNTLGYSINQDFVCYERRRYYSVIGADFGAKEQALSDLQILFGVYCHEKNDLLKNRLLSQYNIYIRAPLQNAQKIKTLTEALSLQGVEID